MERPSYIVDRTIVQIGSAAALLVLSKAVFDMSYVSIGYTLMTISIFGIAYFTLRFLRQRRFVKKINLFIKRFVYGRSSKIR